ncbi:facilitated trehalose transporter Tret1-like [Maniola jurtina]|uniref:facilitated trehalose transporter Tret1-like n=1 Tax=Maniola jurtina TaxID=191418 RepID=UPI001E68FB77|nr:facilitated trehalose transporter Tret1-like [Maniola jurtina]
MFLPITGVQRQVIISSCLYLGQMIAGYTLAWTGPVIPKLRDLEQSPLPYLLTETQLSLVATITYLGAIPGPYITVWLSNTKGRKPCFIFGGLVLAVSYTIMAASTNLAMLYIGRFLVGIGSGVLTVMNLVYIGEIASTNIRGILLSAIGIFNTLGSIVMFSFGPFVSYHATTYLPLSLSLVYIFFLLWLPETPIFYILQGKDKELLKVLQDLDRLEDKDKLLEVKKELTGTSAKKEWIELFSIKSNRKALFIVVVINILQHCSGVLGIVFFSAAIFEMAGSSINSNVSMIVIGCFQLSGSSLTPFFIERAGRKIILMMSSALCSLSMFILGLYFYLDHIGNSVIENVKWLPLVLLILFYIGYDSGLGIIPNAIIGEMFTSNVRSKGSTVTMTTSWIFGFMVTTAFGAMLATVGGHVAFWFFSSTCACAVLFTIFFIPETKGKSLMEIQENLS